MMIYFLAIKQEKVDTKYPFSYIQLDRKYPSRRPGGSTLSCLKLQSQVQRIQASAGNMRFNGNLLPRVLKVRWYGFCLSIELV